MVLPSLGKLEAACNSRIQYLQHFGDETATNSACYLVMSWRHTRAHLQVELKALNTGTFHGEMSFKLLWPLCINCANSANLTSVPVASKAKNEHESGIPVPEH